MNPPPAHTKINVFILTGFLGAGKTTLLNFLLKQFEGERNVVIENEFGKANIDAQLIDKKYDAVFELTNGCICCSLDEDLYDVLNELVRREDRIHNLFIETTGIADAGSVAAIFKSPDVSRVFDLKKVLCLADAQLVEDYLTETEETQKQLVAADLIILNKVHLVSNEYLATLKVMIQTINPIAKIIDTETGCIDKHVVLEESLTREQFFVKQFNTQSPHKINNVLYESDGHFIINTLYYALNTTLFLYYDQIFRIKGFVKGIDNEVYEVHSVGKTLTIKPIQKQGFTRSQLVVIGRQLKTETVQRILRQAVVKSDDEEFTD